MQLHQLENVSRDKTSSTDVKMNSSTLGGLSDGEELLLSKIHQSCQTESVIANGKYH